VSFLGGVYTFILFMLCFGLDNWLFLFCFFSLVLRFLWSQSLVQEEDLNVISFFLWKKHASARAKKKRMQKQTQLQLACKIGIIHPRRRKFNFNLDYSLGGKTI